MRKIFSKLVEHTKKGKQTLMGTTKKSHDKRLAKRIPYSGCIFFTTKRGFIEGELINYSTNGLFIKTDEYLTVGELITVAPPYTKNRLTKLQAQIIAVRVNLYKIA